MKSIEIYIDLKTKKITMVQPNEIQLELDERSIIVITPEMIKEKVREPINMFEDDLLGLVTVEQEIALYNYWGDKANRTVMVSRTASNVDIDKDVAKAIIKLAEKYGLLASGWNSTWRVKLDIVKERWLAIAKEKESYLKDPDTISRMPKTPQESADKLASMSTPEQKRRARGEEGMIVKEENAVEVIDDSKIYSGAAKAKEEERKRWEQEVREGGKKAVQEMNKKQSTLPASIIDLTSQYKAQEKILPKKKPVSTTSLRKR